MRVFITGITGTLGTALARLHSGRGDQVFGCARGEARIAEWLTAWVNPGANPPAWSTRPPVVYGGCASLLGLASTDMGRVLPTVQRLYHCAALKRVEVCEADPQLAWRQNVLVTDDVCRACTKHGVQGVVVSSDKACLPEGVYGATKLVAERVAVREGLAAVRLGNLIGSSGSVFETWGRLARAGGVLTFTSRGMTRYFILVQQAAEFVADLAVSGRVAVPDGMRAANVWSVCMEYASRYNCRFCETGPRQGEVEFQWLVSPQDRVDRRDGSLLLGGQEAVPGGLRSDAARVWGVKELVDEAEAFCGRGCGDTG